METRVTKILPSVGLVTDDTIEDIIASGTVGTTYMVDGDFNALAAATATISAAQLWTPGETRYLVHKVKAGTTADSVVVYGPIRVDNIKNASASAGVLPIKKVVDFDLAGYVPVIGQTYVLRVLYLHNKDLFQARPNVWFFSAVAETTDPVDLVAQFVTQINNDDHIRNQIVGSTGGTTSELRLTAKYFDTEFDSSLVSFTASNVETVVVDADVSTARVEGIGVGTDILAIEKYSAAYQGHTNRRGYPVDEFTTFASTNELYDVLTVEVDHNHATTDIAQVRQISPITYVIPLIKTGSDVAAGTLGTDNADYTAIAGDWEYGV